MSKEKVLECINLKKQIKDKTIVENISFSIETGDVVGLIGPNGAGKTTTIKLILGLIKPTEGKVIINGYDLEKDFKKAINKVGAIVETPTPYMYLSGYDNLKIAGNNYKNIGKNRIDEVVKIVGLENRIKDRISTYSLGMRQRLGIAEAIINEPNLLILDEPTNGLDVEGIIQIRKLIQELSQKGIAILISSHNLSEIDKVCNKIIAIKNGKIIANDTIEKFKAISKEPVYILKLDKLDNIQNIDLGYKFEIIDKDTIKIYVSNEGLSKVMQKLIENNYSIYSATEYNYTSEEAFIEKVGENKID